MKKIIALILAAALMCAAFTGCSGSDKKTEDNKNTEASGKTVADIKAAGKLVIATSPDFPPFEELKSDGSVEGIEIDILNMICRQVRPGCFGHHCQRRAQEERSVHRSLLPRCTGDRCNRKRLDKEQGRSRQQGCSGSDRHHG